MFKVNNKFIHAYYETVQTLITNRRWNITSEFHLIYRKNFLFPLKRVWSNV